MKFFLPQTKKSAYEETYTGIAKDIKNQLRLRINDRRIFSITYVHDKKKWKAEVGKLEQQQGRYEILAIFESKPYIVYTRAQNGGQGLTVLVNNDEIIDIVDFEGQPIAVESPAATPIETTTA